MKLLRSPIVVGLLAVVAVVLVLNSVMGNNSPVKRMFSRPAATSAKPAPKPAAKSVAAKPSKTVKSAAAKSAEAASPATASAIATVAGKAAGDLRPVDAATVRVSAAQWVETPRRDPFQGRVDKKERTGPSASQVLTLKAIWRQTDSTLAVINTRVMSEGEAIQGYTLDTIEVDRVWVEGPNGREPLEFKVPVPETATATSNGPENGPAEPPGESDDEREGEGDGDGKGEGKGE
jgi:hypothetical protein